MVILIFGLTSLDLLIILFISTIFLDNVVGNTFLIWMMSSMLIFELYTYNFLLLIDKANLLLFDFDGFRKGLDLGTTKEFLMKCEDIHYQNILLFLSILR